jgi:hypothetical protein
MSKSVLYPVMPGNSSLPGKPNLANHVREKLIACRKPETSALTRIRGSRVQTSPITLWETTALDCSATDGC